METKEGQKMVYSACVAWFSDWVSAYPPPLVDEYDLSTWVDEEMNEVLRVFLEHAFHTPRARNDAIMICRALFYEYFLFEAERARGALGPNTAAVPRILTAPQTPQKSALWHSESYNILSGHEFGAIVSGGPATRLAAIQRKCGPPPAVAEDAAPFSQHVFLTPADGPLSPFKWGWRFEPVARALFEAHYAGGPVDDSLGRLRHTALPRLGASPDGLITSGPLAGRLVELKCPITRTLNGSIPMEYWIQMQLQAEVCDVEAVEYFEVSFGTAAGLVPECELPPYRDLAVFGVVRVVAPSADAAESTYEYDYSPLFPTGALDAARAWMSAVPAAPAVVLETAVWWVRDASHKTVLRNRRWWSTVGEPAYRAYWEEVDAAREDGRFVAVAKPLFVDMEEDLLACGVAKSVEDTEPVCGWCGVAEDEEESDHEFPDIGVVEDDDANEDTLANDVVTESMPASSRSVGESQDNDGPDDSLLIEESEVVKPPLLEHT